MIILWGFILGIPVLAFGGAMVLSPEKTKSFAHWFRASRPASVILSAVAWLWTAYEVDALGIEAIDRFTKIFPGEPWILAIALIPLTVAWMPKNLPVRALCAILMLLPAELFKTTRLYLPPAGTWFAAVDVIVYAAYAGAIAGMYGMFYPWRLEKGMDLVFARGRLATSIGAVLVALGAAIIAAGVSL